MLAEGWRTVKLISTARPGAGFIDGDWIESPYITGEGIRLVQTGNIGLGEFLDRPEHRKYISQRSFEELGCKWVYPGDILICRLADPIGRTCMVPSEIGPCATAVDCTIYRPNPVEIDNAFAVQLLNSDLHLQNVADVAGGSTRQRISRGNLGAISILLPPLPEQCRIAEILDTADTAIGETEALISKLKQMKTGLMHDLLTRSLDERGQLRDPDAHPEQFKDSPLGRIPREWEAKKLGDVTSVKNGTTPSREEPSFWADGTVPWLPTGKVNDRLIYGADEHITEKALRFCSLDLLPEGSVLVAMVGQGLTRGKVAYLATPACINQNFAAILPCPNLNSKFLFYYLDKNYDRVRGASRGSNQQALNCSVVAALQVVVPPLSEQHRIAEILDAHDARIRAEEAYRDKLKLQKKGLMEDLLTGRVRVKTAQEVVA